MTIQFNADNNLILHEEFRDKLKDHLTKKLNRFSENMTRLEVHLSDDNGGKNGQDDKKCLLEARVEGRPPIAVTAAANNYEQAVDAAIEKLKSSLDKVFGKLTNH
ncbi:MAG: HPF/RaiA family ribosome-associated protein [Ferruginibacter sp.]